jgi:hypothetical protein
MFNNFNFSRIAEVSDSFLKDKWRTTENVVKSEITSIAQLYDICKNIRTCQFEYGKKQVEESNIPRNDMIYIPAEVKKNKMPNIQHFGGKAPFSKDDDPFENYKKDDNIEMKYDEMRVNRKESKPKDEDFVDYVYKKPEKINNNVVEKKDPMVWDPPEEKIEKKSIIYS